MRYWINVLVISLLVAIVDNIGFAAAGEIEPVDINSFEKLSEEIAYDQMKRIIDLKESMRNYEPQEIEQEERSPSLFSGFFNLIAYILIGILFVIVLYVIFSNIQLEKEIDPDQLIEKMHEEEHIENVDADAAYKQAIANENYRLALRMQFIKLLQHLSQTEQINWKSDKTNRDYARELRGSDSYLSFQKLSNIFEWVWYGNTEISKAQFESFNASFSDLETIGV